MIWALILSLVCIAAILRNRRRLEAYIGSERPMLTDAQVRQVEERGWLQIDEPVNYHDIDDEEVRFWEESGGWEEADE